MLTVVVTCMQGLNYELSYGIIDGEDKLQLNLYCYSTILSVLM